MVEKIGTIHGSLHVEGRLLFGEDKQYDLIDVSTGIIYPDRIPYLGDIATGQDIIDIINRDNADGNNSGLNADTLDGYQPSISDVPFTVVVRGGISNEEIIVPNSSIINTSSIQLNINEYSGPSTPGLISWNAAESTINIKLNDSVTLHVGQEFLAFVYNASGTALNIGDVVYADSSFNGVTSVRLARANSVATSRTTLGVVTQPIPIGEYGFVTTMGKMHNVDTSAYTIDTEVYLSPTEAGKLVTVKPSSPNYIVDVGWIAKVSETDGEIFVKVHVVPNADEINYNNQIIAEEDRLLATNVQSAIDELQLRKADVGLLSSNINLYPTTASSDIVGYNRMVSSLDDPDYNTTAVNISTGTINTDDQLVGQLIADAGLFVGNPGIINITTIGNIKRTSGNNNQYAAFYFKVWQRNLAGIETLIATSSETPDVRPLTTNVYEQFSASALLNNGIFLSTDRIVIRYYANLTGNTGAVYAFQFGGSEPVRTLIPVPVSVIPSADAYDILVDTINFNTTTILQPADSNVQAALERLNTHNYDTRYYTETELDNGQLNNLYYTETELNNGQLDNLYYTKSQIDTSLSGKISSSTGVIIEGNFPIYANPDGNLLTDSGYSSESFGLKDNGTFTGAMNIPTIVENGTVISAAANSFTTLSVLNGISVYYFTDNNTANWTINFQGTDAVSLNTLATGKAVTVSILARNGVTPYRPTSFSIQGSAVTPRWQGGTAPTAGNANSTDVYTFTIIRLASGFELLASQTRFA